MWALMSTRPWLPPGRGQSRRRRFCGILRHMTKQLKEVLERAETWPEEDQAELAEYARDIEARRTGVYHTSAEELAAIDEALGQVARGEIASKEEIDAAFATFRGK
jgi:hypothetical protein